MTVSSETNRWEYTGDNTTTAFTYNNKIFADSDLDVYVDGTLQTLTTDYTVSGAGDTGGGSVTFTTAPATDAEIVINRNVADTQTTDLPAGGRFPSSSVEDALDRRAIVSQQQQASIDRSLKAPDTEQSAPDMDLPAKSTRADKVLAFSATGAPIATNFTPAEVDAALDAIDDDLGTATGATVTYTPGFTGASAVVLKVFLDYFGVPIELFGGAADNGTTNNTPAFNNALSAVKSSSTWRYIYFVSDRGSYYFDSKPDDVTDGVRLFGSSNFGSKLVINYDEPDNTKGFIQFSGNAAAPGLDGFTIKKAAGKTGGVHIKVVTTATDSPDGGFLRNLNLTGESGATVDRTIWFDGSNRTSSPIGIRSWYLENVNVFNADNAGESVLLDNIVNFTWIGGGVFLGGGTTANLEVRGSGAFGSSNSDNVDIQCTVNGELIINNAQDINYRGNMGGYSVAASARDIYVTGTVPASPSTASFNPQSGKLDVGYENFNIARTKAVDMRLRSDQTSGAVATLQFEGDDDGGNVETYGLIRCNVNTATDGSEDGSFVIQTVRGGTVATRLTVADDVTVAAALDATELQANSTKIADASGLYFGGNTVADASGTYAGGNLIADSNGVLQTDTATVGTLPTPGTNGRIHFATDGRKNGETAGNGTGVHCGDDGSQWYAVDTGAAVAA